ncbi:uncharacterized protein LOC125239245 [Leguminivora glycinivorella]|uniref:uncharacterized protein LOC125239245 n=1 Tax=Leguminivora glycinivorella TaxID=1035111 RepID=UPI00200C6017|nr:uncharacterized protein LOC125239245 [Leguminivora glycinivorella]
MEVSRKECSNGTALKNDNTKHLPKVPHLALQKLQHSPYSCAECGTDCRTKTQLALHLVTLRHKLRSQWRFQCDACKRKFLDKKGVAEHIQREHFAKQANKCPLCEATFHSARAFVKHAATHIVDTQTDTSTQETRKPRARKGTDTSESTGASHSARAVLKHTAHAPETRKPRANTQTTRKRRSRKQATRKPRARKGTDTGTTPVPQNVLETANVTTEALNGRKLIDTEETTIPNGSTKRTRKIQSTRPRKQTRKTHANGARKTRKRRNQLVQDWDTYSKAQETLKRTKLTHPRKKLAQNYNTNMDMQGTQQRKYFADNCDIYSNLQYTQFHKQLAHNADTYTNAQTYPRKECEHNYGIYTYAQDTQLLNTPKYTHDMQDTQNEEHPYSQRTTQVRKGTQTVAELRKMLKRKLETRIEDDDQRHTYFAGEPDSYYPPNNGPVKKYFINK